MRERKKEREGKREGKVICYQHTSRALLINILGRTCTVKRQHERGAEYLHPLQNVSLVVHFWRAQARVLNT